MSATPELDRRVFAALGLIAGATLLLEVTLIRLLSVALWYPFAYMGLSTAMLGFGGAAVVVSLSSRVRAWPVEDTLRWAAVAFCLSTVLGYPLWNSLPVDPMSLGHDLRQLLWMPLLLILITLPFACAGLFVSRTFAAWSEASPYLYGADLGGATAGVIAFVILLPTLGGPGTLFAAGGAAAVAALLLHHGTLPSRLGLAAVAAVLLASAAEVERWLPLRITENKLLGTEEARRLPRGSVWSPSSTIDVIAANKRVDPVVVIDGGTAMTRVPRLRRNVPVPEPHGLRALAYRVSPGRSTLVVGSGGGVEVAAAIGAGSERVLALEIDGAINRLVRGRLDGTLGGLFRRPEVELITAEARSYLAAHHERFDVVVAFHTISNAATGTGAMSLAENYLLTVEALELLLGRLSDQGVLVMSRPEPQLGRLAATVAAAWPFLTDVREHVAVVTQTQARPDFLGTMVITRTPMDLRQMEALRGETPGRVAYLPDSSGDSQDFFAAALAWDQEDARERALEAAAHLGYVPATLTPATDNRPFFNLHRPWRELGMDDFRTVLASGVRSRERLEDLPVGQVAILLLLLEAILLAFLFVLPPALALRRAGVGRRRALSAGFYFAALGFGFITVEVVLIQAMTRIVGEPGWSMVAVLATLLAASGGGSALFAGRLKWSPARGSVAALAAALAVAFLVPAAVDTAAGWSFAARVAAVVLLVTPIGMLLGAPFSAGLRCIHRDDMVAWAWALNGLLSVGGSIAALILGSSVGFLAAAALAALAYGGAAWAGRQLA
jgi:spermidine synthase